MFGFPAGPTDSILRQSPGFARRSRRHRYFCRESSTRHPGHRTRPGQHLATRDLRHRHHAATHHNCGEHARPEPGEYLDDSTGSEALLGGPHPFQLQPTAPAEEWAKSPHLHIPERQRRRRGHDGKRSIPQSLCNNPRQCRAGGYLRPSARSTYLNLRPSFGVPMRWRICNAYDCVFADA